MSPRRTRRALSYARHRSNRLLFRPAIYTPQALVERATSAALHHVLHDEPPDAGVHGTTSRAADRDGTALRARLARLRVLDPACGSGAFLVHTLERLATWHADAGDPRPIASIRRSVCANSIFGVDINPTAVWLCELRLWLSVVIEHDEEDPDRVPPLPNLDHNIRVGDALAVPPALTPLTHHTWGGAPWGTPAATDRTRQRSAQARTPDLPIARSDRVTALRARYATLSGPRKLAAARRLDALERTHALATFDRTLAVLRATRAELLASLRTRDLFGNRSVPDRATTARLATLRADVRALARRRAALATGSALPFGFAWHFPDAAADGGFDVLVGNPPWVRPHALTPATRDALRTHYASARDAPWRAGTTLARAGLGFAAQTDLAAPFTERALALTRPGGVLAFIVPTKLWRTLSGGGLRSLLAQSADVLSLEDWADAPAAFDAVTYPSLLIARRRVPSPTTPHPLAPMPIPRPDPQTTVHTRPSLQFDPHDAASPWLLLPADARHAFDALRTAGPALGTTDLTRPMLGVKSGHNAAFLVQLDHVDGPDAFVHAAGRHGTIERDLLRPVLRGEDLGMPHPGAARSRAERGATYILWPYDTDGRLLTTLPPGAAAWLAPARAALAARSDARASCDPAAPWWALFRTEAGDARSPRVVWPDLARVPTPRLLPVGSPDVPLNTCYAARFTHPQHALEDARAFATLLRSPPVTAWLAALAEPARGGYRRYLGWTVAALPLPPNWESARQTLARIDPSADANTHTRVVAGTYGLSPELLAPLLAWARLSPDHSPSPTDASRPLRAALAEPAPPAWARRPRPRPARGADPRA